MKIRIKGNMLRYRLTKPDVEVLANTGFLQEHTRFANQTLTYALKRTENNLLTAAFENNIITLWIPATMISSLKNTDEVGFEGDDGALHLLVEKDFTCLDNVEEDQSDNYPNPLASPCN